MKFRLHSYHTIDWTLVEVYTNYKYCYKYQVPLLLRVLYIVQNLDTHHHMVDMVHM